MFSLFRSEHPEYIKIHLLIILPSLTKNRRKMESIIQIHNVSKTEFISIIESVIEDKFAALKKTEKPENLTVKQTAKLLGVTELTVHNYIKKGFIKASKIGRRVVIKSTDLNDALSEVKSLRYKRK